MLAERYGQRPSLFVGLEDGWLAYQMDLAALLVGQKVDELTAPDSKGRPRMSVAEALRRMAGDEAPAQAAKGQFRDAKLYVTEKMAIPESGVW